MFEVKGLRKSIQHKQILNNVDFKLERGQIGLFLGGSGVGKTTLLRVLSNLEPFDEGTCKLDGNPLDLATVNKNHTIGMVFQHFNLFEHLSVEENITLPLLIQKKSKEEAKQIAKGLLKRYGLEDKAEMSSQKLSGGQKQRLAIARSLALNPQIICLDEPTSALDPTLTNQIAQYIKELAQEGRIVLITTHDMSLVDQLEASWFLMREGTIKEHCLAEEYKADSTRFPLLQDFFGHSQS